MRRFTFTVLLLLLSVPSFAGVDSLIPDYMKVQYAGNIGFFSLGTGYSFLKDKINMDVFYGFVPARIGGKDIHMITQKNTLSPISIKLGDSYTFFPLSAGILINFALGDNYVLKWPSHYPQGYYRPTACYTGEFLGMRLKKKKDYGLAKEWEIYIEVGTLTPYLHACIENDYIKIKDILNLAIGSSFHF